MKMKRVIAFRAGEIVLIENGGVDMLAISALNELQDMGFNVVLIGRNLEQHHTELVQAGLRETVKLEDDIPEEATFYVDPRAVPFKSWDEVKADICLRGEAIKTQEISKEAGMCPMHKKTPLRETIRPGRFWCPDCPSYRLW